MTAANPGGISGPMVAGGVVILSGEWLEAARQTVLIAARARHLNGLPASATQSALASAFSTAASASTSTLVSANGHSDVREIELCQRIPCEQPTVPISDAAVQLGLSDRQVRRLADELGGRKIGGRWLLDQDSINEHQRGR
jgi:hypothetical protein